ncbi:MAG: oligosaccharide flippase family protein [Anaerolineaceae bacterium]|nr:oligosaccharide flippase family protein [Anaerolineaceae bacterium]
MKSPLKIYQEWKQDKSLGDVVKNTGYMITSNTATTGLTFIQGILAAVILGPIEYGLLGMVVSFSSNINRLFSFRMGEMVVKFGGEFLENQEFRKASALIKFAGLAELITSILAYILLIVLAPWAAKVILKDPLITKWIIIYGVALLANFSSETSTAILQIGNQFRNLARLNFVQSLLTAIWIVVLFFSQGNLIQVLLAYLAGKLLFGSGLFILAINTMNKILGKEWWEIRLSELENKKSIIKFAISTNISGTLNIIIRDSEVLWVGYFLSPLYAGYFKFSIAVINAIILPISQLITVTYPQINKSIVAKQWNSLKKLLSRTSLIAFFWVIICSLGLVFFGEWVLSFIKDGAYVPALPYIFVLIIGYGFASIFFWNRNVLLSFNQPNVPLLIMLVFGGIKTILMFVLIPRFGYLMQAGLLSGYFVISIGMMVILGVRQIRNQESREVN